MAKSIFEIQALLKLMENSPAIKAMDSATLYAILKKVQNNDAALIDKLYKILLKEQSGYDKAEKTFAKDLKKTLEVYQYKIDTIAATASTKQKTAKKEDQIDPEEILQSPTS